MSFENILNISIQADPHYRKVGTYKGVAKSIVEKYSLSDEAEYDIAVMLKRMLHLQKLSVYERIKLYSSEGMSIVDFVQDKIETHKNWASKPDEEIIT